MLRFRRERWIHKKQTLKDLGKEVGGREMTLKLTGHTIATRRKLWISVGSAIGAK